MSKIRKVCVFSGKRGGFGAYVPLMNLIEEDLDLELQIVLGDMHLSKEFGNTVQEAREMFPNSVLEVIEMGAGRGDSAMIRVENLGVCLQKAASILSKLKPDILFVHGDRGEHLVMALAALNLNIPITHTQGGDVSGNIDDIQRHAISKLSHLHFPESDDSAERIRRMGEEDFRVHVSGSLYVDRIVKKMFPPFEEICGKYNLGKDSKYFILLFHPDTFEDSAKNKEDMNCIVEALKNFVDHKILVIYPCSDPGYLGIVDVIESIKDDPQFLVYKNIDNLDFLGLLGNTQVLVGNSSCALVEAPYLHLPAINIGNRQLGRKKEKNVVDVVADKQKIIEKINFVLTDNDYKVNLSNCGYHLGDGCASERILGCIKNVNINKDFFRKRIIY